MPSRRQPIQAAAAGAHRHLSVPQIERACRLLMADDPADDIHCRCSNRTGAPGVVVGQDVGRRDKHDRPEPNNQTDAKRDKP